MNWLEDLYDTYEDNVRYVGKVMNGEEACKDILVPGAHIILDTHITITLNPDGSFVAAQINDNNDQETIVPATEDSASPTGGFNPHPLCDKLQYLVRKSIYFSEGLESKCVKSYPLYHDLLKDWADSSNCKELLNPVLTYIEDGDIISDLVKEKILAIDDGGKILPLLGKESFNPIDAIVRWNIISRDGSITHLSGSEKLRVDWQEYQNKQTSCVGLCYIKGKVLPMMRKHRKVIRNAKLISSNDKEGYTFKGRFTSPDEACGVSIEVSWKAHNVLKWLIDRQGRRFDDLVILAWSPKLLSIPSPCDSSSTWLDEEEEDVATPQNNQYQQQIRQFRLALAGNTGQISNQCKEAPICVLSLNSASLGRMSLSSFQEFAFSDYLNNLLHWHATSSWEFTSKDKASGEYKQIVASPSIYTIISAAYDVKSNQGIISYVARRLLPCVLRQEPIPRDIENQCIIRASNPNSFENATDWRRSVSVACAVYRYNHLTNNTNSSNDMSLNTTINDRSYLFGRLLAVAEVLENAALYVANAKRSSKESRPTTAERLMQRFQQRPYDTWQVIENSLQPYRQILKRNKPWKLNDYDRELDQIMSLFSPEEDYLNKAPLSGYYLLAYHCQRRAMIQNNNAHEETPEE